jgi:putative hemolysin
MPFQVQPPAKGPFSGRVGRLGCRAIEHVLGLRRIDVVHGQAARTTAPASFVDRTLEALDVAVEVPDTDMAAAIPRTGSLIVVANHPFGGVDGLAMASVLSRVRPDVKLLANELLGRVPELRDTLVLVDALGRDDGRARNREAMRAAMRHLETGGCVAMFPAGEVSHLVPRGRTVSDGPWSTTAARLASASGATVLPIFFEGRNSALFQIAGLVHPRLRTALLPRELLKRRGSRVVMHVGNIVPPQRLAKFADAHEATDYLRLRTYLLGSRGEKRPVTKLASRQQPVAMPGDVEAMAGEVAASGEDRKLVSAKELDVYLAPGNVIPRILREIGRLREITFRAVGEGTGKPVDLDAYDRSYQHLFVWNRETREVVAAYRLGLTDEILPRFGGEGLYTSTLFRFRDELLRQLTPGIELGRSFVRGEYQKSYLPLMLLWKGIGTFVSRNPRYRLLFGPVSISNDYASLTRQILVTFLECNAKLPALARLLAPKNPPNFGPGRRSEAALAGTVVNSIEEVDELVAEIERNRRRVPVLLRQYLKLGAKLLAFNVDPDFGDVLDGLMLIDLAQVRPHVLGRYMGTSEVQAYRAFHGVS